MAPYLYTVSTMHCMSVSLAGGGPGDPGRRPSEAQVHCMSVSLAGGGPGLGAAWGHQVATHMLEEAGFKDVKLFERVDPLNSLYVARSP
jgi:hypothetical protein